MSRRANLPGMFEPIFWPQTLPCKRYSKRMRWSAKFIKHLNTCKDCRNTLPAYEIATATAAEN
jgi:hypothetical protein